MAKQTVNVGTTSNDRTGDSLRSAFTKINSNFTELYTQLGINSDDDLNLGAFEFTGSTLTTTDSSAIVIDQAASITGDFTVGGDIVPNVNEEHSLGSSAKRFKDIYLSGGTIDLGGTTLSIVDGKLQVGGADVGATVSYNEITDTPTIPSDLSDLTNDSGFITANDIPTDFKGSVFADDSTLLVDGVAGKIVGPVENNEVTTDRITFSENTSLRIGGTIGDVFSEQINLSTIDATSLFHGDRGGFTAGGANAGVNFTYDDDGIYRGGLIRPDVNRDTVGYSKIPKLKISANYLRNPDIEGVFNPWENFKEPSDNSLIEIEADQINLNGNVNATVTGDVKGSVFGDDSTLLVDGVSGTIPASVVSGTITNDISTNSLETITDIRFGTYADARKPKISIAGIGEHDIAITAGYDISGNDSGNVNINANTDGATPGVVNIATSSGELSLGKSDGTTDVFGEVEFHGSILFQDGDGVDFNGPVDFSDATITGDIPGYVKVSDLKTALQDGAGDYAAFKAWVLANL